MARTPQAPRTVTRKSDHIRISGEEASPNYNYEPALPRESAGPQHYPIRRILGETKKKGKTQYLVDWFPSYVPAAYIKDAKKELKHWQALKKSEDSSKLIFNYDGKILLRDDVESENNSEETQRLMFETVLDMVKKELGITKDNKGTTVRLSRAKELFGQTEWMFADGEEKEALRVAKSRGDRKITAAALLTNTYLQILAHGQEGADNIKRMKLPYGKIKLTYIGQLDDAMRSDHNRAIRRDISTLEILEPIFFPVFETMDAEKFAGKGCLDAALGLRRRLRHVCKFAPYLLQRPWILFLTRIFVPSDDLVPLLKNVARIKVKSDWPDRSRDIMMHVYRDEKDAHEHRAPHDVQETYLSLRDLFQDMLEPKKHGGKDGEVEGFEDEDEDEVLDADAGSDEHGAIEDRMDVDHTENSE